jgi:uncharacterized membrane protein YeaQ/YmgE (transglycosylase-associated protein family)
MEQVYLFLDSNPWISILFFAALQLWAFIPTLRKLDKFKGFFSNSENWKVEEKESGYAIHVENSSEDLTELVGEINEYLEKNEGTTDFGIIKDKVENRLESLHEDATSKISFPTYLGLMGTFFGVWIGLQSFKIGVDKAGVSDEIVSALIGGVIVSMVTSLIGLVLMMWGNAKAGDVLKKVEGDKNKFFDFIQVRLMPVLGTSMVSALNKLHRTINTFEPAFKGVIGEFKDAFSECTETLRGTFGEKVQLLTSAVETMGKNMSLINENVKMQEQLLKTMQQRETLKTLESFVVAADKFDAVTTSIAKLSEVKEELADSSVKLVEAQTKFIGQMSVPERVFEKINAILNRIVTFEESLNALGESISQTQLLGNSQMNLIQEQITAIQKKTDLAISYQELADDELKAVYETQKNAIKQLNEKYCAAIDTHGDDFALAMNEFKQAYEKIVKECMDAVEAKRDEYIAEIRKSLDLEAKNQHLAQLAKMPELLALLSNIQSSVKVQPEVSSKITTVSNQIDGVKSTLDAMEKKIGTTRAASQSRPAEPKDTTQKKPWLKRLFSRKK